LFLVWRLLEYYYCIWQNNITKGRLALPRLVVAVIGGALGLGQGIYMSWEKYCFQIRYATEINGPARI